MIRPPSPKPTRALTPQQVADQYAVSADRVRAWISSGELRAVDVSQRRGGRPRWRITPDALAAFEAARSTSPTPKQTRRRRHRDAEVVEFF